MIETAIISMHFGEKRLRQLRSFDNSMISDLFFVGQRRLQWTVFPI
jgi:hypothetical protein